jgi:hypothetical protein
VLVASIGEGPVPNILVKLMYDNKMYLYEVQFDENIDNLGTVILLNKLES